MLAWLSGLWLTQRYLPHGLCLAWRPWLIWLELMSNALIAISYYSIPAALAYVAIKRRDVPFRGVFVLFILFILACGTTHALGALTLRDPVYRLDASVEALTALVSVPTAVTLWLLLPEALAMPSPAQLAALNRTLSHEIEEHRRVEQAGAVRHGEQHLFTCFVRDLTEREEAERRVQELQAELAHVSRLTEMGQLASGIAHELNQPLTATANYLGATKRLLDRGAMSPHCRPSRRR